MPEWTEAFRTVEAVLQKRNIVELRADLKKN